MQHDISLLPYNTFGIDVKAKFFTSVEKTDDLIQLFKNSPEEPLLILGGGSNILLTRDFEGTVIKNEIKGIEKVYENEKEVHYRVGGGEDWHNFVTFSVAHGLGGIENLALIPGNVGASPMQNIGAYGVEIKDVFVSLEAFNLKTHKIEVFDKEQCQFGYRSSVFKHERKGQYLIAHVTYALQKQPILDVSYGALKDQLTTKENYTLRNVFDAVIKIRESKLPNPHQVGSAGSFFKNPYVRNPVYDELKAKFPEIPAFRIDDDYMKIPAGWLIEQCGYKGLRRGAIGVYPKQALVLVNYGGGEGNEIFSLAMEIKKSVKEKFGIALEPEVNII